VTATRAVTANPDCDVCHGTGTDPVFFSDCTECWPEQHTAHREELWHARRQARLIPTVADTRPITVGSRVVCEWSDIHGVCIRITGNVAHVKDSHAPVTWTIPTVELHLAAPIPEPRQASH
jgi:hypothetical protein